MTEQLLLLDCGKALEKWPVESVQGAWRLFLSVNQQHLFLGIGTGTKFVALLFWENCVSYRAFPVKVILH